MPTLAGRSIGFLGFYYFHILSIVSFFVVHYMGNYYQYFTPGPACIEDYPGDAGTAADLSIMEYLLRGYTSLTLGKLIIPAFVC